MRFLKYLYETATTGSVGGLDVPIYNNSKTTDYLKKYNIVWRLKNKGSDRIQIENFHSLKKKHKDILKSFLK